MVLAVGMLAMMAACASQYGLPYLIPALRDEGLSLGQASMLAAAPTGGLLLTLVAWGAAADRWSERVVLSAGLSLSGLVLLVGMAAGGPLALGACFFVAGAAGGSVHAASGRLILGWFAPHERGLAMGLRQTAQPLGVAAAALTLPSLASSGRSGPLLFLGVSCLAAAALVAVAVRDPRRTRSAAGERAASPYRVPALWRIHGTSALLIVSQLTVATFALVYLVDERGWEVSAAGRILAATQVGGAAVRLAVGYWSDRVRSRMRPMRTLAVAIVIAMVALAVGAVTESAVATIALVTAAVVTVSPNGLAFTAVAEYAGPSWAGRALGIQNTVQNLVAAATPPVIAAVIAAHGYGTAFAAVVLFPLLATGLIPVAAEGPATPRPGTVAAGPVATSAGDHHPDPAP
jgi:sugar phosphate permease